MFKSLPNSLRVSLLTYKAIVAVRYPELVLHDQDPIQIGHFVAHDHTVEYGGFRAVLWDAPKDLRAAVEDVVAFLFFSSSVADVALWLGPYMSISRKESVCTRTTKVQS